MISLINNRFLFLFKFFLAPKEVGSITPSSSFLAKKMFEQVLWEEIHSIVELGAGTGVFTEVIDRKKRTSTTAVVIEKDKQMRMGLENKFPSLYFGSDAENLDQILKEMGIEKVDCVVSGLPFANFSPVLRKQIVQAIRRSLKPGGLFIAFQYSLQMKNLLKENFSEVSVDFVPFNIPPAFIYRCK